MGQFKWMLGEAIPANMDLRRLGWSLIEADAQGDTCVQIIHATCIDKADGQDPILFTRPEDRRMMVVVGVNCTESRRRLLEHGFGDAVSEAVLLEELEARARRVANMAGWVPRRRSLATLNLDLMARDASYLAKPLHLHPREFALLWRLAETPDDAVSKQELVQDVWRLGFMPESNSIAVQMSRLRSKLAAAGLAGLVVTVPGGYLFRSSMLEPQVPSGWSRPIASGMMGSAAAL